ncbi:MAG: tetratricopeptide repeat protein [Desulfobacterales bacterium]
MGKKKKKNRSRKNLAQVSDPTRKAREHLAAGRFRQAVDAYKVLCKTDRDGYLAPLKAAYEGLYRQRLEKGLFEEAAMVLDQLEKLSGDSAFFERVALYLKRAEYPKAADAAAKVLSTPDRISDKEALTAVDALVVAFDPAPAENALPAQVRQDLGRIRSALESMAGEHREDALERIKPIGTRSLFSSWKWLIKGMGAFYGREDEKAVAAFEKILPATAPAAAAAPYLRLLQKDGWRETEAKDIRLTTDVCVVAGCGAAAEDLARAEYLWTVKRFRDSYAHLRRTLEDFPTCSRGLTRSLTELYYNTCFEMPPKPAQKYVEHLVRSAFGGKADNTTAKIWAQRSLALYSEENEDFDLRILEHWEKFIDLYESLNGDSPRVRSLVYGRLGNLFSEEMAVDNPFSLFFFRRRRKEPDLRNIELARHCYQQSVEADPQAFQPQVAQVAFFEKIGDTPHVNRLLDRLIRQFPDEKEVLFKAGLRCSHRKAYVKAMNYLERALSLDPMDKLVREQFILTCIVAALQYVRKNNPEKAQALLPRALEWSEAHSDDFNRGRAYLYARWTAMAHLLSDDANAQQLWAQADAHRQGSELKLHFFYWVVADAYGVAPPLLKGSAAFVKKALKDAFSADTALDCIRTLEYASQLPGSAQALQRKAVLVERYLARGATAEMTRQQAGVVVSFTLSEVCSRPDIAEAYIRRMLKRNPDDALFRYYRYLVRSQEAKWYSKIDDGEQELNTILRLAREQKDATVTLAVQKLLREIDAMPPFGGFDGNPFFDIDDDFEEEDMPAEDDDFSPFFSSPPEKPTPKKKPTKKKAVPRGPQQLNLF